jgi:hypothetical protein
MRGSLVSVCDELPWAVEVPDQAIAAGDHLARLDRGRRGWWEVDKWDEGLG